MNSRQLRILFLTKYARNGASSRYRSFQYLPWLEQAGIHSEFSPLFDEAYLVNRYKSGRGQIRDILRAFIRRVSVMTTVRRFDLVVIEKEFLPYFPAIFESWLHWLSVPYVVDFDDALFHQYDQHKNPFVRRLLSSKISNVIQSAQLVIVGNRYLADYAQQSGAKHVVNIPTVVDLERYSPKVAERQPDSFFIIGWIGSPATAKYLQAIAPALAEICKGNNCRVRLIGSGPVNLPGVPVEVLQWNEATEVSEMKLFDVGIMPLPDEPWARGKCGLKLIQYMACSLPVVASPVGVNCEIVDNGINGFLANTHDEWLTAFHVLMNDDDLRKKMGQVGRLKAEESYSLQVTGPRLAQLLTSVADKQSKLS